VAVTAAPSASAQTTTYCGYTSSEPVLRIGSSGAAVKQLQCLIHYTLPENKGGGLAIDGVFGQGTLDSVYSFQSCMGLSVDGVVGPQTWAQLDYWGPTSFGKDTVSDW
jgi:peptidoglycan hydrolase-like protein with peptidoglycan-binding domain